MELHQLMNDFKDEPALPAELASAPPAEPHKFNVGPETFKRVFQATGLTNLSDMQAVLDAVEAALAPAPEPAKRPITAILHDAVFVKMGGREHIFARVEAHSMGAFKDGSVISTSPVVGRWRDIVWTENSCYYIASERVDPNSTGLASLVQRLQLLLREHGDIHVETPGGEVTELQLFTEGGAPSIGAPGDKVAGVLIQ